MGVFPFVAGFAVVGIMMAYLLLHPPVQVTIRDDRNNKIFPIDFTLFTLAWKRILNDSTD